jgi:hypothetical protein
METKDQPRAGLSQPYRSSLFACNGILEVMAELNRGCDHDCMYSLEQLDGDFSLAEAVASRFQPQVGVGAEWTTEIGNSPRQARATVRLDQLQSDWKDALERSLASWFFAQAYSPKTSEINQANVIRGFLNHFSDVIQSSSIFHVTRPASMSSEVFWEGYAFTNSASNFLLHFGFTD